MTVNTKQVSVDGTETQLVSSKSLRVRLRIENTGSGTVYVGEEQVGGNAVTAGEGYPVKPNEVLRLDDHTGEVNAITGGSTETVKVLEQEAEA